MIQVTSDAKPALGNVLAFVLYTLLVVSVLKLEGEKTVTLTSVCLVQYFQIDQISQSELERESSLWSSFHQIISHSSFFLNVRFFMNFSSFKNICHQHSASGFKKA